jgi:hypothetical protein
MSLFYAGKCQIAKALEVIREDHIVALPAKDGARDRIHG